MNLFTLQSTSVSLCIHRCPWTSSRTLTREKCLYCMKSVQQKLMFTLLVSYLYDNLMLAGDGNVTNEFLNTLTAKWWAHRTLWSKSILGGTQWWPHPYPQKAVTVTLHGKRDSARIMTLRISRWGDDPRCSKSNVIKGSFPLSDVSNVYLSSSSLTLLSH